MKMQIKGVWGTPPTSILQRKKCFCIDENIACLVSIQELLTVWTVRSLRKRFNVLIGWVGTIVTRVNNAPVDIC